MHNHLMVHQNPAEKHLTYHHGQIRSNQPTYRETCVKIIYLTCATIITTTLIVECILLHLVIVPSVQESGFIPENCVYLESRLVMSSVKCENKCSKDRSTFQCVRVLVMYTREDGHNFTASLFDNIATYQYYNTLGCATSSCHRQNTANRAWVQHFCQIMKRTNRFPCFVHKTNRNQVLLHKFYGPSTMFNTLFWPLILLASSSVILLIVWFFDRCHAWHDEDTVIV